MEHNFFFETYVSARKIAQQIKLEKCDRHVNSVVIYQTQKAKLWNTRELEKQFRISSSGIIVLILWHDWLNTRFVTHVGRNKLVFSGFLIYLLVLASHPIWIPRLNDEKRCKPRWDLKVQIHELGDASFHFEMSSKYLIKNWF